MRDLKNIFIIIAMSLTVILLVSCDSGDKHGLHIQYEVGQEYALKAKVSDVKAGVSDGEFTDFSGYNATIRSHYKIESQEEDEWVMRLFIDDFTLDSIYEMDLNDMSRQEIAEAVKSSFNEEGEVYRFSSTGEVVFLEPVKVALDAFNKVLLERPSVFYQGQFFLTGKLIESQYSFNGNFNKGVKWEDEFFLIDHEKYGFQAADRSVSMKWELLRLNDKEVTFFGSGRSVSDISKIDLSQTKPIDVKRQFGINLVFNRDDFWLNRGNIDLRSEFAELHKAIDEETEDVETIRSPYEVRNIKIKYFDKEDEE